MEVRGVPHGTGGFKESPLQSFGFRKKFEPWNVCWMLLWPISVFPRFLFEGINWSGGVAHFGFTDGRSFCSDHGSLGDDEQGGEWHQCWASVGPRNEHNQTKDSRESFVMSKGAG